MSACYFQIIVAHSFQAMVSFSFFVAQSYSLEDLTSHDPIPESALSIHEPPCVRILVLSSTPLIPAPEALLL